MIETIDPTIGEILERIPLMDARQIDAKLEAAARAFERWSRRIVRRARGLAP